MVSPTPQFQSPAATAAPVAVSQADVVDVLAVATREPNYLFRSTGKAAIWKICRQITVSEGNTVCQVCILCHPNLTPQEWVTKFNEKKKKNGTFDLKTGSSTLKKHAKQDHKADFAKAEAEAAAAAEQSETTASTGRGTKRSPGQLSLTESGMTAVLKPLSHLEQVMLDSFATLAVAQDNRSMSIFSGAGMARFLSVLRPNYAPASPDVVYEYSACFFDMVVARLGELYSSIVEDCPNIKLSASSDGWTMADGNCVLSG